MPLKTVRDRTTGKMRKVDLEKSAAARKAAVKRKGKPLPQATRSKITKAVQKAVTTGRTASGRKSLLKTKLVKG